MSEIAPTEAALPLAVVGGYLGAGKTTLVNRLLREVAGAGRRIAVLVNDFGEVSIDADLVVGAEGGVLALAGGCVCCAFGADLVGAVVQMAARVPRPDALLVETSGVGLPAAVARTAALSPGVRIDSLVVLADTGAVRTQAADRYVGGTVWQQLREADLVLLSKVDLAGADDAAGVTKWMRAEGVAAPVIALPSPHDGASGRMLHALVFGPWPGEGGRVSPQDAGRGVSPSTPRLSNGAAWTGQAIGRHWPGGTAATAAPVARLAPAAADLFETRTLRFNEPVDVAALGESLRAEGVLRAKGVLLDTGGRWLELQVAGGRVHAEPAARPARRGDEGTGVALGEGAREPGADGDPESDRAGDPAGDPAGDADRDTDGDTDRDADRNAACGRLVVITLRRD